MDTRSAMLDTGTASNRSGALLSSEAVSELSSRAVQVTQSNVEKAPVPTSSELISKTAAPVSQLTTRASVVSGPTETKASPVVSGPTETKASPISQAVPVESTMTEVPTLPPRETQMQTPTFSEQKELSSKQQTTASSSTSKLKSDPSAASADTVQTISATRTNVSTISTATPARDQPQPSWTGPAKVPTPATSDGILKADLVSSDPVASPSKTPSWLVPVAIGAVVLGVAYYFKKKR